MPKFSLYFSGSWIPLSAQLSGVIVSTYMHLHVPTNTAEKRLRMRGNKKDGEEFKCKIINKNMAI